METQLENGQTKLLSLSDFNVHSLHDCHVASDTLIILLSQSFDKGVIAIHSASKGPELSRISCNCLRPEYLMQITICSLFERKTSKTDTATPQC
jgi:hypothetical protein